MGDLIVSDEVCYRGDNVLATFSVKDYQRDVELLEFFLHDTKILHDEVYTSWAGAMPFELRSAIDVGTDQRLFLVFSQSAGVMQTDVVMDPDILTPKPVEDFGYIFFGILAPEAVVKLVIR